MSPKSVHETDDAQTDGESSGRSRANVAPRKS
jgi:hypothetical protein